MLRLIITRHGETRENLLGVFQGHLPGRLTHIGIDQAKRLAERLKSERFDHIYSSDLARVKDTTKEIVRFHPDTPLSYVTNLREIHLGELQGRKKSALSEFIQDPHAFQYGPPGGETYKAFQERAIAFLEMIKTKHANQTILLVCHQNIGKALIATLTGKDLKEMNAMGNLKNTSISKLEIGPDNSSKLIFYNCCRHLEGA